jgi:alpha-D-glucose phosphate-specific phosphoglucomutase
MSQIKFGTDGWRAVTADAFTFDNLDRVAQATADFWKRNPVSGTDAKVVIGYDRRFLADQFAARSAEILAGNGFQVILTDAPTPTPAVSYEVKRNKAVGGIMLTASHNPPIFNGFKIKAHYGGSADPAICRGIESRIDRSRLKSIPLASGKKDKTIQIRSLLPSYLSVLKKRVDFPLISKSKLRFAHDALFGVGAGMFDELLKNTQCRVTTLNGQNNPGFGGINPEPILSNYGLSQAYLKKNPHDVCLVTDGDADRVGGMDGRGNYLSAHQIICLLLFHLIHNRKMSGRVVKALTTSSMVDKLCDYYGMELVETGVGFKYICEEMLKGDVLLGAEESGGIGFKGHIPERDGILAGLMLLELLAVSQKSIRQLCAKLTRRFGPHCYGRIDTRYPLEKRGELMEFCRDSPPDKLNRSPIETIKTFDGVKYIARDGSWLMIRGSGTEPILRIYAETTSDTGVEKLLKQGVRLIRQV